VRLSAHWAGRQLKKQHLLMYLLQSDESSFTMLF
jgi:hypothetical protein